MDFLVSNLYVHIFIVKLLMLETWYTEPSGNHVLTGVRIVTAVVVPASCCLPYLPPGGTCCCWIGRRKLNCFHPEFSDKSTLTLFIILYSLTRSRGKIRRPERAAEGSVCNSLFNRYLSFLSQIYLFIYF